LKFARALRPQLSTLMALEGAELALRDEIRAHAETRRCLQDALDRPRVDGLLGRLGRFRIVRALLERIGVDEPTARRD
jgi:hypothetical protein